MKRVISALLGLLLLAAPAAMHAQSGSDDDFNYTINPDDTNTITITGYTGPGGAVTIPTNINGLTVSSVGQDGISVFGDIEVTSLTIPGSVTSIGVDAFSYSFKLASVSLATGLTSIGDGAFADCYSLTNVTIPASVTNIGEGAFTSETSLTAITVDSQNSFYRSVNGVLFDTGQTTLLQYPGGLGGSYTISNSVTSIGDYAFENCYLLTNVTIPDGVTSIGDQTFGYSGLTSVTIPGSVTNIGDLAFTSCTSLTAITVDTNNSYYSSANGVLFNAGKTTLLQYPPSVLGGIYTIPDSVTSIGDSAFAGAMLTNVTIPDSVTNIGDYAFSETRLTSVTIPGSVTSIGAAVFSGTTLTSVTIPDSVTSIGVDTFSGCRRLTNVTISSSVTNIEDDAFSLCTSLTNVTIPDSVTLIGGYVFAYCTNLTGIYFEGNAPPADSNPYLSTVFFDDTNVTVFYLPGTTGWGSTFAGLPTALESLQGSGDNFNYTINPDNTDTITITNYTGSGGEVIIPTNINSLLVTIIGDGEDSVFAETGVTSVTIPGSVTSIGAVAFYDCTTLTSVTIPGSVINIGENAFESCNHLTNATISGSVTSIGAFAFANCGSLSNVTISNGVTSIGESAFLQCYGLASVTIPESVTNIGAAAFAGCISLTNVTIPSSVNTIGSGPFAGCTSLTAILVDPENLFYSSLDGVLFDYSLTSLIQYPGGIGGNYTIPTSVTNIGDYAFSGTRLTSVMIPTSVTSIGDGAFLHTGLNSITIPGGVTKIGEEAFAVCTSLTNVTIADSVISIGEAAFNTCTSLTSVTIPASVTSIGEAAFEDCTNLTNITLSNGVTGIGVWAFTQCFSLTSVTIPGSVTTIGQQAFEWCYSLTNITIGNGVTNIGEEAFANCGSPISIYFEGNAPTVYSYVAGGENPTVYYLPGTSGWSNTFAGIPAVMLNPPIPAGSLQVTISPTGAITAGAQWQVDDGIPQPGGATVLGLSVGNHTVSFSIVSGWVTPANQIISVGANSTATTSGIYTLLSIPSDGLLLLTNGYGNIQHGAWPKSLVIGKKYKVTAVPKAKNVFVNWVGGTVQPYSVLSTSTNYTFTMEPNLVLEANFVTNVFLEAKGAYTGLFARTNSSRQQTNSGSFLFNVTSNGAFSGNLDLGDQTVPFSGKFDISGRTNFVSKRAHGEPSLTTTLQLDFADQSVSGTVSDGAFTAELNGYRNVFSGSDKATEFEGQYTLVIPGTNDPTVGPFGTSYGTVKVSSLGIVTLAGSLADGTAISQSSVVSQDGYWPLYVNLYGGKGSLWGWSLFTNQTITAPSGLSWINATNSARTAVYRSGFTNQQATLTGGLYLPSQTLPTDLTATLEGGDLLVAITNGVTLSASDKITLTNSVDETNKLKLTITKSTGVISGSFANPANPKQTIKINGVILQDQTNAQGYFLGTNQSGTFTLDPP